MANAIGTNQTKPIEPATCGEDKHQQKSTSCKAKKAGNDTQGKATKYIYFSHPTVSSTDLVGKDTKAK